MPPAGSEVSALGAGGGILSSVIGLAVMIGIFVLLNRARGGATGSAGWSTSSASQQRQTPDRPTNFTTE